MSRTTQSEILTAEFFSRPALTVARQLLGKYLVRRDGSVCRAARINEVEAYVGAHDLASHGRFGNTSRTAVMFGPGGHWYVYLIYGMYWMLNIVTDGPGKPSAVLLRGAGEFIGPGRLTRGLAIDRQFNERPSAKSSGLWIEDRGDVVRRSAIRRTPRIGIDYAGPWKDKPYRFVL